MKSFDKKSPTALGPILKAVISENEGVAVQAACKHVAEAFRASVGKYGLMGNDFHHFVQALRVAYYRDIKDNLSDEITAMRPSAAKRKTFCSGS